MDQVFSPPRAKVADIAELQGVVRARRAEFERLGHVPRDMVAALKSVGVYRAFVPKSLGGDELSPGEFCRLIEQISQADASTGWVASFGVSTAYLAALPKESFEALYGADPNLVFAGSLFPPQPARQAEGGLLVSGRWPYCSGCMGADLIGVGTKAEATAGGLPRMVVMRAQQVRIDETWDCIGLGATGSHDVVVEDVFVPFEMSFVRGATSTRAEPIFRYPAMALAAEVLAVVGLGVAQEALNYVRDEVAGRASITGAPTAASRPYLQQELAQARAELSGARAYFYDSIETAWESVVRGDEVGQPMRVELRLAASNAARAGAEVARKAFELGGIESLRRGHVLSRCMIDAASVAQHAFLGLGTWAQAGAGMLGHATPPGYP